MADPNITFTTLHTEKRWSVSVAQKEKTYAVYLTCYGTQKMSVFPLITKDGGAFRFQHSDPNTVLAIGRLLVAAARKCGASDA